MDVGKWSGERDGGSEGFVLINYWKHERLPVLNVPTSLLKWGWKMN